MVSASSFTGDVVDGDGGGISNAGTITVTGTSFSGDQSISTNCCNGFGAGLFNTGTGTITNSTFTGNSMGFNGGSNGSGGGLFNSGGSLIVSACTFSGNTANVSGGGVGNSGGTMTLSNSTLSGNSAGSSGGGIFNGGSLTVSGCTVSANSTYGGVAFGGGIDQAGGTLELINSTVTGNSCGEGGGIYDSAPGLTVINSTIAYNWYEGIYNAGGAPTLYNTILAANAGVDAHGTPFSSASAYNLVGSDQTGSFSGNANTVGVTDPGIGLLANNGGPTQTIALLAGSPAIGQGMNGAGGFTLFTDQRGYVPPAGVWDIGAYQYNGVPPSAPTATLTAATITPLEYGQTNYTFSITFASDAAIAEATLAGAVVQVVPPSSVGGAITATVVSTDSSEPTDPFGDAQAFTVTYAIIPPGGSWSLADDGSYVATLGGSPVTDIDGTAIASGSIGSFSVQGFATKTNLSSSPSSSIYGQSVTFTARVSASAPGNGTPSGSVIFYDGTTALGSSTLSAGKATLKTTAVLAGSQPITAVYQGNTTFAQSTSNVITQIVSQDGTTTKLSSSASTAVYGEPVTFTATVTAKSPGSGTPTGSVAFSDGTTTLGSGTLNSSGVATYTTSPFQLSVGSGQSITAVYGGDPDFMTSTSPAVSQTVNEDSTTTSVVSLTGPSVYGQPVTFTATVVANAPGSGTPTGTFTFSQGSTVLGMANLSGGSASFTTSTALAVGTDSIKAAYSGDANFKTSAGTVAQTVAKDGTATAVVSPVDPSVFGQSVTFTATVSASAPGSGVPAGSVTFANGSTTLGTVALSGGTASYSTAKLPTGSDTITATYNGSTSFISSSTSVTQTVNQDATTTSITSSLNASTYGQSVTFTATVSANSPGSGTPTGSVTFYNGSTALGLPAILSGGKASLKTSALPAGSDSITVVYSGDTNFITSTSAALTQTVNQDATTTRLTSSANPSVYGQSVTFTATVAASAPGSGTPTGTVTFMDGTNALGTGTLSGDTTTFTTSSLAVGTHSITAVYSGDLNFITSTSAVLSQKVNQDGSMTALVSSVNPSNIGQPVTFTATISASSPGSGMPTGSVTFYVNSKTVGSFGLTAGVASYTTTFTTAGSDTIKAVYSGDTNFKTSSATLTQSVGSFGPDAIVMGSNVGAVDQVLGTLSSDKLSDSPVDELALDLVSLQGKKGYAAAGS